MASEGFHESSLCPEFARSPRWPARVLPPENEITRLPHPRNTLLEKVKKKKRNQKHFLNHEK